MCYAQWLDHLDYDTAADDVPRRILAMWIVWLNVEFSEVAGLGL